MASKIEKLWKQALHCFGGCQSPGYVFSSKSFNQLKTLMNEITAEDVGIDKKLLNDIKIQSAPMGAIEIFENQDITIAVFILKNGVSLPIHNHPEMLGLLKVISGVVRIESYTLEDNREIFEMYQQIPAVKHDPVIVKSTDPSCVLKPILKNLHEVTCLEGPAAFLDILSPSYNILGKYGDNLRLCTYFKVIEVDNASNKVQLVVADIPSDFYSVNIKYTGEPLKR